MKVKNRGCIRRLGFRQLKAAKVRNFIAIAAIMLTTLLFTSLFTIALSIKSSYEEYSFRQAGGYGHGTFKEVNEEQWKAIAGHPKIKETGARTVAGYINKEPFEKVPAEVSWMDENCTKWSYATPTTGRMPEKGNEIAMDTKALEALSIKPKLGEEVILTYVVFNGQGKEVTRTDTFVLTGFWEYDNLLPVHYINVARDYVEMVEKESLAQGGTKFRTDLNVMLSSSIGIEKVMQSVEKDLGYQWEDTGADNCVRIGVNWGYVASEAGSNADPVMFLAIAAFICVVVFTGYLIIYNVFRISVTNDIRFYGMLKTIGTTPRQLRRMIRYQAFALSAVGIPLGIVLGYGVGAVLLPVALGTSDVSVSKLSISPVIFAGAAVFSLVTVCLSVSRPGKMAAKVSPVEALRYTEQSKSKRGVRATRGADVFSMALANMGRSKSKTALVIMSLSLAVVLFAILVTFVSGFDMEKYVSYQIDADFIVSTTEYFQSKFLLGGGEVELPRETVEEIQKNTSCSLEGCSYSVSGCVAYIREELYKERSFMPEKYINEYLEFAERKGELIESELLISGLDESLFSKLTVLEGDIEPLKDKDSHKIAICVDVDDYGNPYGEYPDIGESFPVSYLKDQYYVDSRTGEPANESTPMEYLKTYSDQVNEVDYTVCAKVILPSSMGFRYGLSGGYDALLSTQQLENDSGMDLMRMYYLFDAKDDMAEKEAEEFLAEYTKDDASGLMYESKKIIREDFKSFQNMFLLIGGVLCFIVALVGILNFFNAILTGIITRRREFAMLQSIGMTGRQLKSMLVWEGLFYAIASGVVSLVLSIVLEPLAGNMFEGMFWFFTFRFNIIPVFFMIPVFLLLGIFLPLAVYRFFKGKSIVERLREYDG